MSLKPGSSRKLKPADYRLLLRAALKEDLGRGDLTTRFFVPAGARLKGRIVSREHGVICGLELAAAVFKACDRRVQCRLLLRDGTRVRPGSAVMAVTGGRAVLSAERTALNFLQRLSGVASYTRRFVDAVRGTRARILDTRKTIPGWRALDKYAVVCGGGVNHRFGLYDAVMVKDNHYHDRSALKKGVLRMRRAHPKTPLIIECDAPAQVTRAMRLNPEVLLLDNMSRPLLRAQIRRIRRRAPHIKTEVSGSVSLKTVREVALLGCDRISVGQLTHSAPALDLGFDLT